MSENDEDVFIERLSEIISDDKGIENAMVRFLVFIQVGIEFGCIHLGAPLVTYLLSRIVSLVLGAGTGLFPGSFDILIDELTAAREKRH
jgi:hypothetical protein